MRKAPELEELVKSYPNQAGEQKKQTLARILELPDAEQRVYVLAFGEAQRASLRVLADACRKQHSREVMAPVIARDADKLLRIADDKARKTACALIGLCAPNECASKLAQALKEEKIRFVRPSIILALGNTADPKRYFKGYTVEPGEEKHVREEQAALKKALGKAAEPDTVHSLSLPAWCTLTTVKLSALRAELIDKGHRFSNRQRLPDTLDVRTEDIEGLRCYNDALYYIGETGAYKPAAEKLDAIGCAGLHYRIEAGKIPHEKRRGIIRNVSDGFAVFGYHDSPSAYAFEVRLTDAGMFAVFPGDTRFGYRKESIPASIHPVTAACIMRLCRPYMKKNARVLDPFCGSATMLIEREYVKRTGMLVGVDISPAAIKAACANRKASGLKIALIKGDILGYGAARYDEIIANMPFGIRVSGHQSNVRLYSAFADKLPVLLERDGVAFLFTQEKKLLREAIAGQNGFEIINEENFETGGLCPTLFIIKRRSK